ncbi:hypothetical protein Poli38472_001045 [Pythium oligandrum]|uniref:PH domain-containing protein n=1 Tax=Pythium oligandrum TaxID=41045 RepID=A0A8K1CSS1_PYTOL|nr:hypothetical protein Poli38472_001045 [Pythium oligandrum]|eukprot:TMW68889.1 hypothetical protein Poli38472_001045 [Pythium oligandrum]
MNVQTAALLRTTEATRSRSERFSLRAGDAPVPLPASRSERFSDSTRRRAAHRQSLTEDSIRPKLSPDVDRAAHLRRTSSYRTEREELSTYIAFSRRKSSVVDEEETGLSGFLEYRRLDGSWRPFLFQTIGYQLVIFRVHLTHQSTVMSTDIREATEISLVDEGDKSANKQADTRLFRLGINDTVITLRAVSHHAATYWVEGLQQLKAGDLPEVLTDRPTIESEDDIFRQIDQLTQVSPRYDQPESSPHLGFDCWYLTHAMLSIPHLQRRRQPSQRHPSAVDGQEERDGLVASSALVRRDATEEEELDGSDQDRLIATTTADALALLQEKEMQVRRRVRRRSKNCKNLAKFGSEHAVFRRVNTRHEQRMLEALHRVQQQICKLEERRLLMHSLELARFANVRQLATEKIRSYYQHFSHGYDPVKFGARAQVLADVVRSVLREDVESPAFPDIDTFLRQWSNYSRFHAEVVVSVTLIQPQETDDPDAVIVKCGGLTRFRISRDTIKHFFQPVIADEELVQQLIGKEYCFPFVTLFHFSTDGRVYRMEPRADLAAGLFQLMSDPFSTVKLLSASKLTSEGCLHAYPEPDPDERVVETETGC